MRFAFLHRLSLSHVLQLLILAALCVLIWQVILLREAVNRSSTAGQIYFPPTEHRQITP
jgi:hypothetical protein